MKVISANIVLSIYGTVTTLDYPQMEVKDLAHELIEIAQPKLDIAVSDQVIDKFKEEAKRDYMSSTKLFDNFDDYCELYVRLKIGEYVRVEHAKQAYNDMVLAYEKLIKSKQDEHQKNL